jgi:hypothetical protein
MGFGVEGVHSMIGGPAGRISLYCFGRRLASLPVRVTITSAGRGGGGVGNGSEMVGCNDELEARTPSTLGGLPRAVPMLDSVRCYDGGRISLCHYKVEGSVTSILSLRHCNLEIGLLSISHAFRCSIRSVWAALYSTHCC